MKNTKVFFQHFIYTFSSNFFKMAFNIVIILIMPKLIGVTEYSYFQYYTLLSNYTLYFHFGWCDGIYLRYVGIKYINYNKRIISNQFWGSCLFGTAISIIILTLIAVLPLNLERKWIFLCLALVTAIAIPQIMLSVILQASSRLKESSQMILIEKNIYAFFLLLMFSLGVRQYRYMILGDVLGRIISLSFGIYTCREIVLNKHGVNIKEFKEELKKNFQVGIFLLIANLTSVLITGIPQFFIENKWGINAFGYISFSLNLSKMVMIVINSISVILVPFFRNSSEDKLKQIYPKLNSVLMIILFGILSVYYPLRCILVFWLPEYQLSIKYLALLFPLCLFESKTALLLNTYLKALREEKKMCIGNVISVGISFLISAINIYLVKSLTITIASIPIFLVIRKLLLEYLIERRLKIIQWRDSLIEISLSIIFMILSWNYYGWISMVIYFVFVCGYLYYKKEVIHYATVLLIRKFSKDREVL